MSEVVTRHICIVWLHFGCFTLWNKFCKTRAFLQVAKIKQIQRKKYCFTVILTIIMRVDNRLVKYVIYLKR